MFTKLMFKFLILIYLFSVSSYSQSTEQQEIEQQIEQQEIEYEDDLGSIGGPGGTNRTDVTVATCGRNNIDDNSGQRIIGGRDAVSGQFPWQASLFMTHTDGRQETCGGCILNDQWIITAAHCITDENNGNYLVYSLQVAVGVLDKQRRDSRWQIKMADCAIKHEGWRGGEGGFANDIALIRVPYNNRFDLTFPSGIVNGICLPPKTNPPYEPTGTARISGWGVTENGVPSTKLKYTDIKIISTQRCAALAANSFPFSIIPSMICQGTDGTSPCSGDSGGCLIQRVKSENRFIQVGIVSTGPQQCANNRDPNGVYTKVSHFIKWIEDNVRLNDKNARCRGRALGFQ